MVIVCEPTTVWHITIGQPCLEHRQAAPTMTSWSMVGPPIVTVGKAPQKIPIPLI